MSLTLNSENSLEDFLNLNLNPAPIVITKGNEYSIVNYTFGDNLTFVTESGPAPANFYHQIYNPMLIQNLVVGVGVNLQLTRDIWISGELDLLDGATVTGGNVYETDVPSILTAMGYSWESDLNVANETGIQIGFNSVNETSLSFPAPITCNTNEPLIFNFYLDAIGTQFDLASQSNSASLSRITVLASGSILVGCQVSPVSTGLAAMVGLNTIELTFNGVDNDLIVNGTPVNMPSQTLPFILLQVGKRGTFYADIGLENFTQNSEFYPCDEGTGATTTGDLGTVATLNSTASVEDMWQDISGAQQWTDNIVGANLEAPSPTQRPIYDDANVDFKGLPSLAGESSVTRQLKGVQSIIGNTYTVYIIKKNGVGTDPQAFLEWEGTVGKILLYRTTNEILDYTANSNSVTSKPISSGTQIAKYTVDGTKASNELNMFINGSDSNVTVAIDGNNTVPMDALNLSFLARNFGSFPSDDSMGSVLIYQTLNNVAKDNSINQYLTRKYIRDTYSITTVKANDQKLTLSKPTSIGDSFSITFVLNVLDARNYISTNTALTQRVLIESTGLVVAQGFIDGKLFINGISFPFNTDLNNHLGSVITISAAVNLGLDFDYLLGAVGSSSSDITLIQTTIGNEAFNLPISGGGTTTGTNGTVATLVNGATWNNYNGK